MTIGCGCCAEAAAGVQTFSLRTDAPDCPHHLGRCEGKGAGHSRCQQRAALTVAHPDPLAGGPQARWEPHLPACCSSCTCFRHGLSIISVLCSIRQLPSEHVSTLAGLRSLRLVSDCDSDSTLVTLHAVAWALPTCLQQDFRAWSWRPKPPASRPPHGRPRRWRCSAAC